MKMTIVMSIDEARNLITTALRLRPDMKIISTDWRDYNDEVQFELESVEPVLMPSLESISPIPQPLIDDDIPF